MALSVYTKQYSKACDNVDFYRSKYKRMMTRSYLSFGVSFGLFIGMIYNASNNYTFAMFVGLSCFYFIYGSIMLGLALRILNNDLRLAETQKYLHWANIKDLDFLPVKKNE